MIFPGRLVGSEGELSQLKLDLDSSIPFYGTLTVKPTAPPSVNIR